MLTVTILIGLYVDATLIATILHRFYLVQHFDIDLSDLLPLFFGGGERRRTSQSLLKLLASFK